MGFASGLNAMASKSLRAGDATAWRVRELLLLIRERVFSISNKAFLCIKGQVSNM